jgi:hypothetical protein
VCVARGCHVVAGHDPRVLPIAASKKRGMNCTNCGARYWDPLTEDARFGSVVEVAHRPDITQPATHSAASMAARISSLSTAVYRSVVAIEACPSRSARPADCVCRGRRSWRTGAAACAWCSRRAAPSRRSCRPCRGQVVAETVREQPTVIGHSGRVAGGAWRMVSARRSLIGTTRFLPPLPPPVRSAVGHAASSHTSARCTMRRIRRNRTCAIGV